MSAMSFLLALSTDFSNYFPKNVEMDVYYDTPGIDQALQSFEKHLREYSVASNWKSLVDNYEAR